MADAVEYGLIASLVAVVGITAVHHINNPQSKQEADLFCYRDVDRWVQEGFKSAQVTISDQFVSVEECLDIRHEIQLRNDRVTQQEEFRGIRQIKNKWNTQLEE